MMQQVATPSSKIAVNDSSDIITGVPSANEAHSRKFSEGRSAFEDAIARAENGAWENNKRSLIQQEKQAIERVEVKRGASDKPGSKDEEFYTQPAEPSKYEPVRIAASNSEESNLKELEAENIDADALEQTDVRISQTSQAQPKEIQEASAFQIEDSLVEFDYVNFISQIQSLNTEPVDGSNELTEGLGNDEQALDLANVSLNQEELQVILDAQKAGVNLNESLSQEQLDKLDAAITNMLTQYHQQTDEKLQSLPLGNELDTIEPLIDTNTDAALDKALVQAIIQQPIDNPKLEAQAISEAENPIKAQATIDVSKALSEQDKADINADVVPNLKEINAASAMFETAAKMNDEDSQVNDLGFKEIASKEKALQAALLENDASQELIKDTGQNAERASIANTSPNTNIETQVQVKNTSEDTQALVKQLSLLDERSQTNTIENIKSRVEKFAADLSANTKGSEFVAAMQSGLKEFKEQMQSGREPGIDLKALVSDALAQANVEIPAQNQANVDKALTQFGAIMNLANSVNQSTQAQAQQLFGMTETQMIKESNVLHAEGTKLAQQSASNFDKAVNIFKPEGQQQLAEKVRWMVAGRNPMAEIRLDPPDLGAMQIKVNLGSDIASVNFTVQSSQAKEALDQQLPRLREMLQEQGIELGQSSVQQESSGQAQQQAEQGSGQTGNGSASAKGEIASQSAEVVPQGVIEQRIVGGSLGGIDYYA